MKDSREVGWDGAVETACSVTVDDDGADEEDV